MSLLHEQLSETFQNRIAIIREAIRRLGPSFDPDSAGALRDRLHRRDQQLATLVDWLLDTEQQQILALNPQNVFYLYAGGYLTAITRPPGHAGEAADASAIEPERGIGTLVRERWRDLGLHDSGEADLIAAICRTADGSGDFVNDDSRADDMAAFSTTVNLTLLAAGLQLARALDLSGEYAQREILRGMPTGIHMDRESLEACYEVVTLGPHQLIPGTIRLKIRCHHVEVHRALKAY